MGRPAARIASDKPMRRYISIVRALQRSIFGRNCGSGFCSMSTHRMPRRPRSSAKVNPTGPAPTIMTWVSTVEGRSEPIIANRAGGRIDGQREVIMQAEPFSLHSLAAGRGAAGVPHILAHERILDAADHIGVQIRITRRKYVRDELAVPRRLDEKMDMLGSKGVPILGLQHLAHRAVMWNRVRG